MDRNIPKLAGDRKKSLGLTLDRLMMMLKFPFISPNFIAFYGKNSNARPLKNVMSISKFSEDYFSTNYFTSYGMKIHFIREISHQIFSRSFIRSRNSLVQYFVYINVSQYFVTFEDTFSSK